MSRATKVQLLLVAMGVVVLALAAYLLINKYMIKAETTTTAGVPAPEFAKGRMLVKFKNTISGAKQSAILTNYKAKVKKTIPQLGIKVLSLPGEDNEEAFVKAFSKKKEVEFAQLDYQYEPQVIPNDPLYSSQWHHPKIGSPGAWDKTWGSPNIIIAILDTGTNPTHEDLQAKMVGGWNTWDNNSDFHDVYGHGTTTAGAATTIGNNALGVSGVCASCKLMPIRVSDPSGLGYSSTIAAGLVWAADHGARVANVSYMYDGNSAEYNGAKYLYNKGGLVTMSSGNNNTVTTYLDSPYIITVPASDSSDNRASFSNTGPSSDVIAPGVGIWSCSNSGAYRSASGTSFSAPVTAGVVGMIFSANPSLTPAQAENILESTADDKGTFGWDPTFGWGRVNVQKAVEAALGGPPQDTTPPTVSFTLPANGAAVSGNLSVKINARDNILISNVAFDIDGTAIGNPTIQNVSATEVNYSYSVDTTTLQNGTRTLNATAFDSSSNQGKATISINVSNIVDTTAPTVSITSPISGSKLIGSKVNIDALATDNVKVSYVEFYIDGILKSVDTLIPYRYSWNFRKISSGTHYLQAKAYDARGNVGVSAIVNVIK